ncbi:S9 family peptidase [Crateriforma conspicua]|nr:prolyl oligopeptidase family serine peptidase [Crateriforma conspicua]
MAIVMVLAIGAANTSMGQDDQTAVERKQQPPELSLRSLFHPDDKHDYDGKMPVYRWVKAGPGTDSDSRLIVRRKDEWKICSDDGTESPWEYPQRLRERIAQIDAATDKQIDSAVDQAVRSTSYVGQTVLVRVGGSLAVVDPQGETRLLTRDATSWNDATLDQSHRRVAFTQDGDLFVVDVSSGRSHRMTDDASETILDGRLDWTYQEEIFGRGNYKGFRFSPDGNWLAMLRIHIDSIQPYTLGDSRTQRGSGLVRRYSKAGDPIPHAELYLWDLREMDRGVWPPPRLLAKSTEQDPQIITGMWWHPYSQCFVYSISNRLQTWRELRYVDHRYLFGGTQNQKRWLREESPAWVEPPEKPGFMADGGIIWKSNLPTGRARLFRLALGGKTVTPLTPQAMNVNEFKVDPSGRSLWLTAGQDGATWHQDIYHTELTSRGNAEDPNTGQSSDDQGPTLHRLTDGNGWYDFQADAQGKRVVVSHSTAQRPASLSLWSLADTAGPVTRVALHESQLDLPGDWIRPETFQIETEDGVKLPAQLKRSPAATDAQPGPVVIEVYGGPRAPIVRDRWAGNRSLYHELLARDGISVLMVDNRASGGRGIADTWAVRGRLGQVEFADVQTAVDWLKQQAWVDSDRLAIRGWSFGGFLTLYSMIHSSDFAAGIAGGSVTDWREYDSFYTERYMGLPDENDDGYTQHGLLDKADQLTGRVLLIHGEVDDNVHPSNTMRMAHALQKAGKQFDLMIYPGAAHSVHDPHQSWHLNRLTDGFLRRHLRPGRK